MNDFSKYTIDKSKTVLDALVILDILSRTSDPLTLFVMDGKRVAGTITDGDIRRFLIKNSSLNDPVEKVMKSNFCFINPNEKNIQKIRDFRRTGIKLLPCINEAGELLKVFNFKDKKSILPMDAVLMAGGKGERLRSLTEKTPKPLLKVGEKAIIDYNIDNLIVYGVDNIHVTTNYLADQIEEHFKEERQGIKINCVQEKEYLGTIASIKLIPNIKNDEILVMNADLFTNIDFEDFYRHFLEKDADMSAAAIPYSINVPYGIFELEGRNIQGIKEKPTYNYYANAGIYLIKRNLLDLIPEGTFLNATDFMDLLISKEKTVIRYPLIGYWIDIGNLAEYQKALELVKHIGKN
jgi:dTDP-glucose pyrophosphorylase